MLAPRNPIPQPADSNCISSPPLVLLGQFLIVGRADIDWTTNLDKEQEVMAADSTQAFINRAPVMWLDGDEGDGPLLLLESTKKALKTMGYQIPARGDGINKAKEASSATEDFSGHTEETAGVITDDEIDGGEMQRDQKTGFEHFKRTLNVASVLQSSLTDIRSVKREKEVRDSPVNGKGKHKRLREKALEKQRESLQKRQEKMRNDGEKEEAPIDVDDAANDMSDTNSTRDAVLLLIRTINSLSILTPCILQMWQHPRRRDIELRVAGYSIKKKNRTSNCWMLFHNVCDITTNKQVRSIVDSLMNLYLVLGMSLPVKWADDDPTLQSQCEATIRQLIASIAEVQRDDGKTLPTWTRQMPFVSFNDTDAAMQLATKLEVCLRLDRSVDEVQKRKKYESCVQNLATQLEGILKKRFDSARLSVYGSCLSDLSLGRGADVDMSLYIPTMAKDREDFQNGSTSVNQYQSSVKKKVYETCRLLERRFNEFHNCTPVAKARVPVVKGTYSRAQNPYSDDGSIDFDICFLNDIAVANSELLRQYSLVDPRVKHVMMSVKRWAKENKISSSMDSYISSYAWMNLAIFYLQCLGFVPNLQCPRLQAKAGAQRDSSNHWHRVESLDTFFLKWDEVSAYWDTAPELRGIPVAALLYGFFRFYVTDFPSALYMISIKRGAECKLLKLETFTKSNHFFQIEDPFETFDSHKPHDLGMHATDQGASKIMDCFRVASRGMESALLGQNDSLSLDFLWSADPVPDNKQQPKQKKAQKRVNSQPNRQGQNKSRPTKPDGQKSSLEAGKKKRATGASNSRIRERKGPPHQKPLPTKSNQKWQPEGKTNSSGERSHVNPEKTVVASETSTSNGGTAVATGETQDNNGNNKINAPRTRKNSRNYHGRNRNRYGGGKSKTATTSPA